ncbi:MAG: hypothetical protein BAJALOKI1v1_2660002 [Promethearchaeota archaeon]|nr:MAG: hypothetical protein BAJALOKI1v1_2660002 [Candidatus Lokiarchaeota archaeon]
MTSVDEKSQSIQYEAVAKILFICPKCKSTKKLEFPRSVVDKTNNLTTISIPKFLICDHAFQAFVDKNLKIRGYQSVDFEFENSSPNIDSNDMVKTENPIKKEEKNPNKEVNFKDFNFEVNKVFYNPKHFEEEKKINKDELKQVYEDFWEYIPSNNSIFENFIKEDSRRIHFIK